MRIVVDYYSTLFSSSRPPINANDIDCIQTRLSSDMVDRLSKPFVNEEVLVALKGMHPGKSPRPDDFPALFYQKFWDLCGDEVSSMVLRFLNMGDAK